MVVSLVVAVDALAAPVSFVAVSASVAPQPALSVARATPFASGIVPAAPHVASPLQQLAGVPGSFDDTHSDLSGSSLDVG